MKAQIIRACDSFQVGQVVEVVREIDKHTLFVKSREVAKAILRSDVNIINAIKAGN